MAIPIDDVDNFFAQSERANDVAKDDDEERDAIADESHPYTRFREEQATRERAAVRTAAWEPLVIRVPVKWYTEMPPKREWLLRDGRHPKTRGVFPLGKVGQMIAEGGVGKTMTLCQLAVAVSTGAPWLGAFVVPKPGPVLLVLGEEDAEECERRLYQAARVANVTPAEGQIEVIPLAGVHAPMVQTEKGGNVVDAAFLVWLRQKVRSKDFRLVVIDPLSRFAGKDAEKDNAAATRFVQACESITPPTSATLVAHHTNQVARRPGEMSASSGRGVTGLVDGPRWQCALGVERIELDGAEERERLGEIVTFSVTKSNYAAKPDPIVLRHDLDHGGALVPADAHDLQVIDAGRQSAGLATRGAARDARERADAEHRSAQMLADERAVVRVVLREPGLRSADLIVAVKREAKCGQQRACDCILAVRKYLDVRDGPNRSARHYAPTSLEGLPEHLSAEVAANGH